MAELFRWSSTNAQKLRQPSSIRFDLGRSLRMHRPLSLGAAGAAAAIGTIYLFAFSNQPVSAVFYSTSFILKAAVLLLVSAALGTAAAVAARNLDSRVYVGADVEHVLGVAAMEEVPDFAEVPEESSQVDLLRLANGIARTCKKGSVQTCVFTGTGHGAGVTTLAARVKESLKILERPAKLVDANGTPPAQLGSRDARGSSAALEAADESGSRRDELILTDTAPITVSPDAEYLARFADCVVVVVESGVTTRAQLLSTAECLQELSAAKIGFVVNRIKRANSRRNLRHAIPGFHLAPGQFAAALHRALAEPSKSTADGLASCPRAVTPLKTPQKATEPAAALTIVKHAPQRSAWTTPGIPSWLSDALVQIEAEVQQGTPVPELAEEVSSETGSSEEPAGPRRGEHFETKEKRDPFQRRSTGDEAQPFTAAALLSAMDSEPMERADDLTPQLHEVMSTPAAGTPSEGTVSRLSRLRGIVTAANLKGLSRPRWDENEAGETVSLQTDVNPSPVALAGTPIPALNESVTPQNVPIGLAPLAELADFEGARAPMPQTDFGPASFDEPAVLITEPAGKETLDTVPVKIAATPQKKVSAPKVRKPRAAARTKKAAAKSMQPPETDPANAPASTGAEGNSDGEVQILPAKRGQHRRKK